MDWLLALGMTAGCVLASRRLIHFFQLESYQHPGYLRTLKRNAAGLWFCVLLALPALFAALLPSTVMTIVTAVLTVLLGLLIARRAAKQKAKKAFVYTARIKRLYAVHTVVLLLLTLLPALLMKNGAAWFCVGAAVLLPLVVALSGLLAWPIEKMISEMYFRDAQRRLRERPDLIKIGITGSFGKTSVKFIMATILSEKYQVLATPASFNTPMGLTRVIRERLEPAHQVFLAEMGARHVGDIKELCRLVHPTMGVITSVGPQHLDTFHTVERIAKTKYELMDAIPADGACFFPDDGAICSDLWAKTEKPKTLVSVHENADAGVWSENVTVSAAGSSFDLCTKQERITCKTRLLGEHNIQNILLCAAVALKLGLTLKQIARGVARLEPVEHRLQLLQNKGGMTVIDDAFNSNPAGAARAVKVLSGFPQRRIIVTPGMVELGKEEANYNRELGRQMAGKVDIVVLVGRKHTAPIAEGLKEKGFDEKNIHVTGSLDEAAALLGKIAGKGDTVLFENDLPDHYTES